MKESKPTKRYHNGLSTTLAISVMLIGLALSLLWQRSGPFIGGAIIVFLAFAISYAGVIFKSRFATNLIFCLLLSLFTLGQVSQFAVRATERAQRDEALKTLQEEASDSLAEFAQQVEDNGSGGLSDEELARRSELLREAADNSTGNNQASFRAMADWADHFAEMNREYELIVIAVPEWDPSRFESLEVINSEIAAWTLNAESAERLRILVDNSYEFMRERLTAHGMLPSIARREAGRWRTTVGIELQVKVWELEVKSSEGMAEDLTFLRDTFGRWTYDKEEDLIYFDRNDEGDAYSAIEDRVIAISEEQQALQLKLIEIQRRKLEKSKP